MTTYKHPFGKPNEVKQATDNDTPQQKKFEKATGKDSDSAVGPVEKEAPIEQVKAHGEGTTPAPKGLDKDTWAEAERAALNMNGGFAGVGEEGRRAQIQRFYDQMVGEDEKTRKWEGKE